MYSNDAGTTWSDPQSLAKTSGVAEYPVPMVNGEQMLVIWNTTAEGLRVLPVNKNENPAITETKPCFLADLKYLKAMRRSNKLVI